MANFDISFGQLRIIPPFGKALAARLANGNPPNNDVFVYFGKEAWCYGKNMCRIHDLLILPPNEKPDAFNWQIINRLPILAIDTSPSGSGFALIELLAYELLKHGASIVRIVLACKQLLIYRQQQGVPHEKATG